MDNNKELKPFEKVLVRDNDDKVWVANVFSHYRAGSTVEYVCMGFIWKQCIPYEGNEYLLGTDKDPKCERKEPTFLQKVIAWNGNREKVKGYFFEKITHKNGEVGYKIINPERECIDYFYYCHPEEW